MTTTSDDRTAYLDLTRIQMRLSTESRGMHAVAQNVETDPVLQEYAERRTAIMRRGYEQMGTELAALADEAKTKGHTYFRLLTGEAS